MPPTHAIKAPDRTHRHRAKPSADRDIPWLPLDAILRELPPDHREILIATYFRRQTTRQAAEELGIPHDDVRRRVYHATRQLTSAIGAARRNRPDELPPTDPGRWRRR